MNTLILIDFLKLLIGITTILGFIYKLLTDFNKLKEAYSTIKNEVTQTSFAEILLYGIFSTFLGGITYNLIFDGTLGGSGNEPHGLNAVLWGAVTNAFSFIFLLFINKKISNIPLKKQIIIYMTFLIGTSFGGWLFYDMPISNQIGVRSFVEHSMAGCVWREGIIGIIWSGMISAFGFIILFICKFCLGYRYELNKFIAGLIMAVLSTIIITSLSIICFVIIFPCIPHFDTARGVIAAIALRTALFVNLVNSQFIGQKVGALSS